MKNEMFYTYLYQTCSLHLIMICH